MRRVALVAAALLALCLVYVLAHWALIEVGREVVVLRTRDDSGAWVESRLWVVDHEGHAWLHGADSRWMRNLRERPIVEVVRAGRSARYRAHPTSGPHPRIDALLREKYGIADVWVRFIVPDDETTSAVRLEPLDAG